MTRTCLDLFSGLGGFSAAFEQSDDWKVVTVDLDPDGRFDPDIQADLMDLRPADLPDANVVLASPPCTQFSIAASRFKRVVAGKPMKPKAKEAVALVYHTIGLIKAVVPDYWYLENPTGFLRDVIGEPEGTVTYCQYGFPWRKPTDLWGDHPHTFEYRACSPGADCHQTSPRGFGSGEDASHIRDPAERSKVPEPLSQAIREAIEDAYANPPPEQVTLPGVTQP